MKDIINEKELTRVTRNSELWDRFQTEHSALTNWAPIDKDPVSAYIKELQRLLKIEQVVKEVVFYMQQDIASIRPDLSSARWKQFCQWDILESVTEFVDWTEEHYDDLKETIS